MKVLIIAKNNFSVQQINNVTNIAVSGTNVTVTGTTTATVSLNDYHIQILW